MIAVSGAQHAAAGTTKATVAVSYYPSVDPAFSWDTNSWQIEYATCLRLVSYSDDPAPAGNDLIPEAATALPIPSPNGLVYTFTVKSGFKFSDGTSVTADSFRRAIERTAGTTAAPGYGAPDISDIAGIAAFQDGSASSISGVQVSGNTLTITLTQPDGALLTKLAMPFFCAVPADTPLPEADTTPVPSAGPYYISGVTGSGGFGGLTGFQLLKNPYYTGSRPAGLDEIDVELVNNLSSSYAAAQDPNPTVDYTRVNTSDQPGANSAFGPGSAAAAAGHQQYFTPIIGAVHYLAFNTSRSGLQDARVRQAIATAINRNQLASDIGETPTDDLVSPITPGYVDEHNFNLSGDVAAAQTLMQQAGYGPGNHLALKLVTTTSSTRVAQALDIATELAAIYINVTVQQMPAGQYFQFVLTPSSDWDLGYFGWEPDYTDWAGVINPLLDGRTGTPSYSLDVAHWNDAQTNASLDYANALPPGIDRNTAYEELSTSLATSSVPMAAISQVADHEFVSSRLGCIVHQPVYGLDLARLCLATPVNAGDTYTQPGTVSSSTPVLAAVTASANGSVSVVSASASSQLSGYDVVGQQLLINAPDAPDTDHPLSITLSIAAATLAAQGLTAATAPVLRNGVSVPACSPNDGTVSHGDDPCVTSRTTDGSGNAQITILSSHASIWNAGKRDTTAPIVNALSLGSIAIAVHHSTTISVSAPKDAVFAEFYVDNDAGKGKDIPLGGQAGSFVSPPYFRLLSPGIHNIGVRVRDAAGNWSSVYQVQLHVVLPSSKPALVSRPIVSGTAAVGKQLSTTKGTWTNAPTGYAYQWQTCDQYGASCAPIPGATSSTYTVTAGDARHRIRATVEASNAAGASDWGYMPSVSTGIVVAKPTVFVAPAVSGMAKVGHTLSVTHGIWTDSPTSYAYHWLRCSSTGTACVNIAGAAKSSYTLTATDAGHKLEAKVTATNAAGSNSATSNKSSTVTS